MQHPAPLRVRADGFLLQALRALNRNSAPSLSVAQLGGAKLDAFDTLHTVAKLLRADGVDARVALGKLVVTDEAAALQWLARQTSLERPFTHAEVATWLRHAKVAAGVVVPEHAARFLCDGFPAAASAAGVHLLPLNRDGVLSLKRCCAAVVSGGPRPLVVHVSDVPQARRLASVLKLQGTHTALAVRNVPRLTHMSHEAALLAVLARLKKDKKPKPKAKDLKPYAVALARARQRAMADARIVTRLEELERSVPAHVFHAFPDGLEARHLPSEQAPAPFYTPLAARLAAAVTRTVPAHAGAVAGVPQATTPVIAYNPLTKEWARGTYAPSPVYLDVDARLELPALHTVHLLERAVHADAARRVFIWVPKAVAAVQACHLPRLAHQDAVRMCTSAVLLPQSSAQWVCAAV